MVKGKILNNNLAIDYSECIFHLGPKNQTVLKARKPSEFSYFKYANVLAPHMVWFYSSITKESDLHQISDISDKTLSWYYLYLTDIPKTARITNFFFNPWGDYETALYNLIQILQSGNRTKIEDLNSQALDMIWANSCMLEILLGHLDQKKNWESRAWRMITQPDFLEIFEDNFNPRDQNVHRILQEIDILSQKDPINEEKKQELIPFLAKYTTSEAYKIYGDPKYRSWFQSITELQELMQKYALQTGKYADVLNKPIIQKLMNLSIEKGSFQLFPDQDKTYIKYNEKKITRNNFLDFLHYRNLDELNRLWDQMKKNWMKRNTNIFTMKRLNGFKKLGLNAFILIAGPIKIKYKFHITSHHDKSCW